MRSLQEVQVTVIAVKVKPNSRVCFLEQAEGGAWLAHLKSPPVDGKANEELLAWTEHFQNLLDLFGGKHLATG